MKTSESVAAIAKALAKALSAMKNPSLDSVNPHYRSKYASLAGVRNVVVPVLGEHGIGVMQSLSTKEGGVCCTTRLIHESGEWVETDGFTVPVGQGNAQAACAAATYARRFDLQAACGVVGDDDDDGNTAAAHPPGKRGQQAPREDVADIVGGPSDAPKPPGTSQVPSSATASLNAIGAVKTLAELEKVWASLVPIQGAFAPADWKALRKAAADKGGEIKRAIGEAEINAAMGVMVGGPDGKEVDITKPREVTTADLHNRVAGKKP